MQKTLKIIFAIIMGGIMLIVQQQILHGQKMTPWQMLLVMLGILYLAYIFRSLLDYLTAKVKVK